MILVQMYNIFTLLNLFFLFFKIRVYKRNNEQLIDASLFLFSIIYIQYATKCQMILVQMYNIFRL